MKYEDITGLFAFMYPSSWLVSDQGVGSVSFEPPGPKAGVPFDLARALPISPVGSSDEEDLNYLVDPASDFGGPRDHFRLATKDIWADRYIVTFLLSDSTSDVIIGNILVGQPLAGGGLAVLGYMQEAQSLTAKMPEILETIDTLLSTLYVEGE